MTCRAFDTTLKEPDNDASNLRLYKLISARVYTGSNLPSVAEQYLRAFCDTACSYARRRWVGIALAGMLSTSPAVVQHMGNLEQLSGLGDVILSNTEREETKIIAGLVLREALERGLEFDTFWTSDKVRNSMPNFPTDSDPKWMANFQSFLDALDQLALLNPLTDPAILYPVSIEASDGFRWAVSNNGVSVAIVQNDIFTLLLPDNLLKNIRFIDVPIAHIESINSRPSAPLHDSQLRKTTHEPWDLILKLQHERWAYHLDMVGRAATELTIMFQRSEDAKECEAAIKELQQPATSTARVSRAQPKTSRHHTVCRSSPIDIGRQRSTQLHSKNDESSSDLLGKTPDTRVQPPQPLRNDMPLSPQNSASKIALRGPSTCGKGKLPKVSQATKEKASQRLHEHLDVFDLLEEHYWEPNFTNTKSVPCGKIKKASTAIRATPNTSSEVKTRSKRKLKSDDNYSPDEKYSVYNTRAKQKPEAKISSIPRQPNKRVKKVKTRCSRQKEAQRGSYSCHDSRVSIIETLLGSQRPTQATKASFKKPPLPPRAPDPSSTPTQHQSRPVMVANEPRTPTEPRNPPNSQGSHIPSLPPLSNMSCENSGKLWHGVTEAEILSSNSKPMPASPHAESTAISGHASRDDVYLEKRKGDIQTAKSDPFKLRYDGQKATPFTRRLTGDNLVNHTSGLDGPVDDQICLEHPPASSQKVTPTSEGETADIEMVDLILRNPQQNTNIAQSGHAAEAEENFDVYGDNTLVNDESDEPLPLIQASPLQFLSSPPPLGEVSSHSSTSVELSPSSDSHEHTSEAEEMQWEAGLQPHHRPIYDCVMRVSKRVLRNIIDNESAVTDIADVFANDGDFLLTEVLQRHNSAYEALWEDMDLRKENMCKEMESSVKMLANNRKRVTKTSHAGQP
ncbi:hypothetical protein GQ44DRAFT_671235 [Phaeosphaeriaceae sp. PMI808]|nr:hypothetical protein GQ44DRAFT_671235 [Phaeosphaeriaceae sp. PMI808]